MCLFSVQLNIPYFTMVLFYLLRWLDTVFKKLSYSLLTIIFALSYLNKSVLNCSCILTYFLSNYGSFDGQSSVATATLAYEIYSETMYFAAQV